MSGTLSDLASDISVKSDNICVEKVAKTLKALFCMLLAASCHPSPQEAVYYVNNQRPFRVRRIGREVRRQLLAVAPDTDGNQVDAVVAEVLFRCKVCSVGQMTNYFNAHQTNRT